MRVASLAVVVSFALGCGPTATRTTEEGDQVDLTTSIAGGSPSPISGDADSVLSHIAGRLDAGGGPVAWVAAGDTALAVDVTSIELRASPDAPAGVYHIALAPVAAAGGAPPPGPLALDWPVPAGNLPSEASSAPSKGRIVMRLGRGSPPSAPVAHVRYDEAEFAAARRAAELRRAPADVRRAEVADGLKGGDGLRLEWAVRAALSAGASAKPPGLPVPAGATGSRALLARALLWRLGDREAAARGLDASGLSAADLQPFGLTPLRDGDTLIGFLGPGSAAPIEWTAIGGGGDHDR